MLRGYARRSLKTTVNGDSGIQDPTPYSHGFLNTFFQEMFRLYSN